MFDRGELAVAMRASMAVPGAFAPVPYNGRLLVDGMLVRNLPVDVARKACADVVIAVPVANPAVTREQLGTFLGVAGQAMNIAISANEKAQLATLTDRDVQIQVILEDIGSSDFSKVPEAIPIGEAAARAAAAALSRYSLTPSAYAEWRGDLGKLAAPPKVTIDEVRVTGLHATSPEVAHALVQSKPGETFDPAKADADASRLVARGDYTAVGYGIAVERGGRNVLTYDAIEKPWGPDYVTFDLNLSTDFKGDTQWGIRVDYEKRWLNRLGGEFRTSVQLGSPNAFAAQFYQPLHAAQQFFVAPVVYANQRLRYLYRGETAVGQYDTRRYGVALDVGAAFGSWGELRVGLLREGAEAKAKTGNPEHPRPRPPFARRGHGAFRLRQRRQAPVPDRGNAGDGVDLFVPARPRRGPPLPDRRLRSGDDAHLARKRPAGRAARRLRPRQQRALLRPVQGRRAVQLLGLSQRATGRPRIRVRRVGVSAPRRLPQRDPRHRDLQRSVARNGQRVQASGRHTGQRRPRRRRPLPRRRLEDRSGLPGLRPLGRRALRGLSLSGLVGRALSALTLPRPAQRSAPLDHFVSASFQRPSAALQAVHVDQDFGGFG